MEKLLTNTPLIKITYDYKGVINYVYAKLEYYSLTGSIKDKVAYSILKDALKNGEYYYGMPIVEASSGNTALSFAALGAKNKSPVYIFMPSWVSKERKKLLELYGANIITYNKRQGGFERCINEAKKLSVKINGFMPNQFSNYNNILAHQKYTAKEIIKKLKHVDTFVSGIGTGGTLTGCAKVFKKLFNTKIVSIKATSYEKNHNIDGITDGIDPDLLEKDLIDKTINVLDNDAINMAIKFSSELGLGVGISSAANFIGSVLNHKEITVTVFPDDNKKYLSKLKIKKRNKDSFISNNINLINYEII